MGEISCSKAVDLKKRFLLLIIIMVIGLQNRMSRYVAIETQEGAYGRQ